MRRRFFPIIYGLAIVLVWSCGQQGTTKNTQEADNTDSCSRKTEQYR